MTYIVDDENRSFYRKKKKNSKDDVARQEAKEYEKIVKEVTLPELIVVSDLADRMTEKTGDVVKKLFSMGVVATSNQTIDADTAEQLFNPFYTTKKSGLGMGLSICKSIIQIHGGSIWFLPNADKGTTFHITLPTALEKNE